MNEVAFPGILSRGPPIYTEYLLQYLSNKISPTLCACLTRRNLRQPRTAFIAPQLQSVAIQANTIQTKSVGETSPIPSSWLRLRSNFSMGFELRSCAPLTTRSLHRHEVLSALIRFSARKRAAVECYMLHTFPAGNFPQ